ncbi:hypothetical protein INN71_13720 [Nocardioides sp. ChNu-153]|uniref:hypothetical protein n=1 Tax=unclassified Nocardioides TaxID=2615069 RepID=UPI002405E4B7|nr:MULTISPECIES: hypothetical protein [unclassified Nocardioides]MDF9714958.1 hypothetical protein [Nocardioides sp. ChNu-99]MDN7122445.1 hypothetical protein [Nocardioides sp. ChNu-153]
MDVTACIYSPDGAIRLTPDAFLDAALLWWPEAVAVDVRRRIPRSRRVGVRVEEPGQRPFEVRLSADGTQLLTDGDHVQQIWFATWARSHVPYDAPGRVVLVSADASRAALLTPGMTPREVWQAWRGQSEEWQRFAQGWLAGALAG